MCDRLTVTVRFEILYTMSSVIDLVRDDRVHRRVYTDPAIFDEEMRRVFGGTWVFAGHESEIPEPGDYKTDTLGRRPIVMIRGADGRVRVFFNVCRHRASKVCYENYGNGSRFRCMYHGWTYDTTGRLIGVPLRDRFDDLDVEELGLVAPARVDSYHGFVFVSLRDDVPPLPEHLGRATNYLDLMCDRAPGGAIETLRPIKCEFRGNWKLSLENYSDNYHPSVLHQSALETGVKMLGAKYGDRGITLKNATGLYVERAFGAGHGVQDFADSRGAMWMNAYANPLYLDALAEKHGTARAKELAELDMHVVIYPNLLIHMRMNNYRVVKPLAVDSSEVWTYPCKLAGAPDDVNETLAVNTSHHVSSMGEIQVDDLQSFAWIQEGLQAEAMEWILLKLHGEDEHVNEHGELEWRGSSEEIIRRQYREWARLMSGLPTMQLTR